MTLKVGDDKAGCCGASSYNTYTQVSNKKRNFRESNVFLATEELNYLTITTHFDCLRKV